jgi:protein TonB
VQTESAPTITTQSTISRPDPPVVAPPAPPAPPAPAPPAGPTAAAVPNRGNVISEDDYPSASRAAEEEGVVRVTYVVGVDGRVNECEVTQSSGFKRLDDTTCNLIKRRFRFKAALRGGSPVPERKTVPVRWQLTN